MQPSNPEEKLTVQRNREDRRRGLGTGRLLLVTMLLGASMLLMACGGGGDRKRKKIAEYGPPRPTLESISPTNVYAGDTMTLTGTRFDAIATNNQVEFDGSQGTVLSGDETTLDVIVPNVSAPGLVSIIVPSGRRSNALPYRTGGPQITSLLPAVGAAGTPVTIQGRAFSPIPLDNTILFDGTQALALTATATTLTCTVPSTATTGDVTVTVAGEVSNGVPFTVLEPTITALVPAQGPIGAPVTIQGSSFSPVATDNIIRFGGIFAPTITATSTDLTCVVPAGAATADVTAEVTPFVSNGVLFTVLEPTITALVPAQGAIGPTSFIALGLHLLDCSSGLGQTTDRHSLWQVGEHMSCSRGITRVG